MNYRGIFIILLVISATPILSTLFEETMEVPVQAFEKKELLLHLNQPVLEINSSVEAEITIDLYSYNGKNNNSEIIYSNISFNTSYIIEDLKNGAYILVVQSDHLSTLTIDNTGFHIITLVLFFLLAIVNIVNLYLYLEEEK